MLNLKHKKNNYTHHPVNLTHAANDHYFTHPVNLILFSRKPNTRESLRLRSQGTTINAGNLYINANNLNLTAGRAKIIGSTLLAGNNINAQTDVGDIEIVTATNSQNSYTYKKEVRVGFGDVAKNILQPEQWIKTENGRLTLTLADATYDESDSKNSESTAQSSVLQAGNSINLTAAGDITVEGSQLLANAANDDVTDKQNKNTSQGNINLTAGGDISITDATNRYKNQTKDISGKAELSLVVQNQVVEVANAAVQLDEAKKQFKQAQEGYRQYQKDLVKQKTTLAKLEAGVKNNEVGINQEDIRELREFIQSAESDKGWYQAGIAAATLNLTSKSTLLIQQTAAAIQSTGTYGFNAGVQLDIEATKTNTAQNQTAAVASILQGRNITLSNQGDTLIKGSMLLAKNTLTIDTKNLNIFASRNTASNTNKTERGSITIAQTVYGTAGGPTVNASMSQSRAQNNTITYTNSTLRGKNLTLITQENATLRGATVRADETLVASIGGDLTIESVQNKTQGKNNSFSISGGFGFGAAEGSKANSKTLAGAVSNFGQSSGEVASVNAGLSAGAGRSRTKQTVLSSLTAGNTANVIVKGRTQLKGALLATVDKDNNDLGNLSLTTGSFGFEDLSNTTFNSNRNAGLSSSVGLGSKATTGSVDKTNNNATGTKLNTTNVQYSNSTGYEKTKTLATLGQGNITLANSDETTLERLNRDTTKTNKDIYKTKRQQGNIDLTIDTRLFSKGGRNAIKEDVLRTGMIANTLGLIATTEKVGITDFFRELGKANTTYDAVKAKIAQSPALAAALQNPDLTQEQEDAMLNEVTSAVMVELGYKTYKNVTIATTAPGRDGQQVKGYYSTDTKKAYINALYNNSNRDLITTAGVESTRAMDQQDGVDFNQNREDRSIYARNYGSNLANYTDMALILSGNEGFANQNKSRDNRSEYVLANNREFIGLDKTQGDNNPLILVPIALELIDKGLTVYDAYQLQKAISEGRTEDAKNITTELGMGVFTEVVPGNKILLKVRKVIGGSGKDARVTLSKSQKKELREQYKVENDLTDRQADRWVNRELAKEIKIEGKVAKAKGWKEGDRTIYPNNKKGYDAIPGTVKDTELQPGDVVTRYKLKKYDENRVLEPYDATTDKGSYVSKGDVPFDKRSLEGKKSDYTKETFVVKKPIQSKESKATPWFDKKGAGNQNELKTSQGEGIKELVDDKSLMHIGSE